MRAPYGGRTRPHPLDGRATSQRARCPASSIAFAEDARRARSSTLRDF